MAGNTKKTSTSVASTAAKTLRNPKASKTAKSLAGSALSQVNPKHQTGAKMESKAAKATFGKGYSKNTRKLAGSVLSQSNKAR